VHGDRAAQGWGFVRSSIDAIFRHGENLSAKLSHEHRLSAQNRVGHYSVTKVEARWAVGKDADIRLIVAQDKTRSTSLSFGTYW
jgi:hypothetical protein